MGSRRKPKRKDDQGERVKNAYQRPRIIYREQLEVIAAACFGGNPKQTEFDGCTTGELFS